jgi:hypothetical protein
VTEGKARERELALRLGPDGISFSEPGASTGDSIKTIAYAAVIGLYQSRSREPRWVSPNGAVNPVAKLGGGGMFGFLKGDRHWLTIRTKEEFVAFRTEEEFIKRIVAALEERTKLTVVAARASRGN